MTDDINKITFEIYLPSPLTATCARARWCCSPRQLRTAWQLQIVFSTPLIDSPRVSERDPYSRSIIAPGSLSSHYRPCKRRSITASRDESLSLYFPSLSSQNGSPLIEIVTIHLSLSAYHLALARSQTRHLGAHTRVYNLPRDETIKSWAHAARSQQLVMLAHESILYTRRWWWKSPNAITHAEAWAAPRRRRMLDLARV